MKIKMLAPWKKSYDQPRQHIKKQRHYFANKFPLVKPVFPVVMYGCESWTIKKAECPRIDAFELWCWRRLLRVPWTVRRSFTGKLLLLLLSRFSRVRLFATPWITARQACMSITNSRSSLKLMSIESVMPSSHLILCCPLLLLPPIPPSIRVFFNESAVHMRWPKYWSFSFSISLSKEHPGHWITLLYTWN